MGTAARAQTAVGTAAGVQATVGTAARFDVVSETSMWTAARA